MRSLTIALAIAVASPAIADVPVPRPKPHTCDTVRLTEVDPRIASPADVDLHHTVRTLRPDLWHPDWARATRAMWLEQRTRYGRVWYLTFWRGECGVGKVLRLDERGRDRLLTAHDRRRA